MGYEENRFSRFHFFLCCVYYLNQNGERKKKENRRKLEKKKTKIKRLRLFTVIFHLSLVWKWIQKRQDTEVKSAKIYMLCTTLPTFCLGFFLFYERSMTVMMLLWWCGRVTSGPRFTKLSLYLENDCVSVCVCGSGSASIQNSIKWLHLPFPASRK